MRKALFKHITRGVLLSCILTGCSKNFTRYHADAEAPGLAIFSNQNFNLLTCYADGKAWRTVDRETSGFVLGTNYELDIIKIKTPAR